MSYASIFAISAAGMTLERTRVEVAALNVANANTTAAPGQVPFQPLRVVISPQQGASFASFMTATGPVAFTGKPDFRVQPASVQPRLAVEPGHPMADERGVVRYPGVNTLEEMKELMDASRGFEANLAAFNIARGQALKALEIGGAS